MNDFCTLPRSVLLYICTLRSYDDYNDDVHILIAPGELVLMSFVNSLSFGNMHLTQFRHLNCCKEFTISRFRFRFCQHKLITITIMYKLFKASR